MSIPGNLANMISKFYFTPTLSATKMCVNKLVL